LEKGFLTSFPVDAVPSSFSCSSIALMQAFLFSISSKTPSISGALETFVVVVVFLFLLFCAAI